MRLTAALPVLLVVAVAAVWPAASGWARAPISASGSVELAFTPWDDAEGAILKALHQARRAVYVQAYLFTSRSLAQALIEVKQRGVKVEVLADQEMLAKGEKSQIPRLVEAGIPVWLETRYAVAHNKIILVDPQEQNAAVITGSYNFTFSAQARNAENLLILRGNPELAHAYFENWQRHRSEATTYSHGVTPQSP